VVQCLLVGLAVHQYAPQGFLRWAALHGPTPLTNASLEPALVAWGTAGGALSDERRSDAAAQRAELFVAGAMLNVLAQCHSVLFGHARPLIQAMTLTDRVLRIVDTRVPDAGPPLVCALTAEPLVPGTPCHVLQVAAPAPDDGVLTLVVGARARPPWPLLQLPTAPAPVPAPQRRKRPAPEPGDTTPKKKRAT
jgi:hypothetical protein